MIDTLMLLCIVLVSVRVSILSNRIDRNDKDLNDLTDIVAEMWDRMKDKDR